jgi:hypothetical protein
LVVRASFGARIFLFGLAILGLLAASGCAASNRETFMRERAGEHVYERPMPEVWAAAKQLLTEDGYTGREVQGGWVYVTEWKDASGESSVGSRFTRYLVEGKELGPTRSIVRFTVVMRATGSTGAGAGNTEPSTHAGMAQLGGSGEAGSDPASAVPQPGSEGRGPKSALATGKRDLEMEWRLLKKLDPGKARNIEGEALLKHPD